MRNSRYHTSRGSNSKFPRNPTSTATTVWEYAVLLYLALNYILQDNPRHVQYREKAKQSRHSTSSTKHCQNPSTSSSYQRKADHQAGLKGDRESNTSDHLRGDSQSTTPNLSHFQHHKQSHHNRQAYRPKIDRRDSNHDISRAQMSEAWGRIRAVSIMPGNPVGLHNERSEGDKRAKKVRWGVVQTRQFESATDATHKDTASQQEHRSENKHIHRGPADDAGDRENRARKELWTSVEKEGEHEIWGPTEGSDGQFD